MKKLLLLLYIISICIVSSNAQTKKELQKQLEDVKRENIQLKSLLAQKDSLFKLSEIKLSKSMEVLNEIQLQLKSYSKQNSQLQFQNNIAAANLPSTQTSTSPSSASHSSGSSYNSGGSSSYRTTHTGPRGGKYYINSKGNKTYIKRK